MQYCKQTLLAAIFFISVMATNVNAQISSRDSLMNDIFNKEIEAHVSGKDAHPNWDLIQRNVKKYGKPGQEIFARARAIHYLNRKDLATFIPLQDKYMKQFNVEGVNMQLNNWAFDAFNSIKDRELLKKVCQWSKKVVATEPHDSPIYAASIDTYANLLYKLGKRKKAIEWEKKAIAAAPESNADPKEFEAVLQKMQAGEPTWTNK